MDENCILLSLGYHPVIIYWYDDSWNVYMCKQMHTFIVDTNCNFYIGLLKPHGFSLLKKKGKLSYKSHYLIRFYQYRIKL